MLPDLTLDEPRTIALTAATALVAGVVRGYFGFGGPAFMALVLTQFYSPLSVLTKVMIIDAVSFLLLIPGTVRECNRRVLAIVTLATLAGLPFGAYLLLETDPVAMKRAVAASVAACVVVMLLGLRFRAPPSVAVHIAVGALAGVVLGATYIALVVMVFFFSLPTSGAESRANGVLWSVVTAVVLIATHVVLGNVTAHDFGRAVLLGAVYLAGAAAGTWCFRRTGERVMFGERCSGCCSGSPPSVWWRDASPGRLRGSRGGAAVASSVPCRPPPECGQREGDGSAVPRFDMPACRCVSPSSTSA